MPFIYSKGFYADIGYHVFPMKKYGLLRQRLIEKGILAADDFVEPDMATEEDLLLVHTDQYVYDFMSTKNTERIARSELPLTKAIRDSYLLATGATILAARKALESRVAVSLSGGFHHAFSDHAEGFCYTNDIAIAIRRLQKEKLARRFLVVDCDLHQGNGTAFIFRTDSDVFTFSMHQEDNYPMKEKSDLDIGLADGTTDDVYLNYLHKYIPNLIEDFDPEMVIYLAGADPYEYDKLGDLGITMGGLRQRDEFIIKECLDAQVPVIILMAGGYALDTDDTVTIHYNTCEVAYNLWRINNSS